MSDLINDIKLKFNSGNVIQPDRAVVTLEEWDAVETRIKELDSLRKEEVVQAFMAGQVDCGVDPSYSSALVYYEKLSKAVSDE